MSSVYRFPRTQLTPLVLPPAMTAVRLASKSILVSLPKAVPTYLLPLANLDLRLSIHGAPEYAHSAGLPN